MNLLHLMELSNSLGHNRGRTGVTEFNSQNRGNGIRFANLRQE